MASRIIPFNVADPVCAVNQCLRQVIGSLGNDPVAQYSSCVSMFGSPSTVTVTLPADDIFSTATATADYTDIIVTLSTTSSTQYETSTSYIEMTETATEYSSTRVATVTEVVTVDPCSATTSKQKRSHKKRGCGGRSSTVSTSSPSSAAPDATVQPPETTTTPVDTTTEAPTTSSSAAPNCADAEEYSSACSCINAVSSVAVSTNSAPAVTEVVTATESNTILSTSTSAVTVVVSSTIVVPVTTTITSTSTGLYETTTTVTSTTAPAVAATQTSYIVVDARQGKYLNVVSGYVQLGTTSVTAATSFNLTSAGGQPSLATDSNLKMRVHSASGVVGVLYFETDASATAYNDAAVTCTVNCGIVTCAAPSMGFDKILSCGAYLYLAKSSFTSTGCLAVTFRASS